PGPQVGRDTAARLEDTEPAQGVGRPQWVVEERAPVVDAAHPRSEQEVLAVQDLMPEPLDNVHFGEEAVPADIEAPAVPLHGAADAADDLIGLEDLNRLAALSQAVSGGQTCRSGPDDDDRFSP